MLRSCLLLILIAGLTSCKDAYFGPKSLSEVVGLEDIRVWVGNEDNYYILPFETVIFENEQYYGVSGDRKTMLNEDISKCYVFNPEQRDKNFAIGALLYLLIGTILSLVLIETQGLW